MLTRRIIFQKPKEYIENNETLGKFMSHTQQFQNRFGHKKHPPKKNEHARTIDNKDQQQLDDLVRKSRNVLYKLRAVFPFDFFPDEVTIDEYKINIVRKYFWWSQEVHSFLIKDIKDVLVETNPFFATLKFKIERYTEDSIQVSVSQLKKSDAMKARRIIQGLMVSMKEGIEFSKVHPKELVDKIETLGKARAAE